MNAKKLVENAVQNFPEGSKVTVKWVEVSEGDLDTYTGTVVTQAVVNGEMDAEGEEGDGNIFILEDGGDLALGYFFNQEDGLWYHDAYGGFWAKAEISPA
jgi:hypothetical protein